MNKPDIDDHKMDKRVICVMAQCKFIIIENKEDPSQTDIIEMDNLEDME